MSDEVKIGAHTFGEFYAMGDDLSAVKHISGSSLTIPGQARNLGALLAASKFQGGMVPQHGRPRYDEDLASGSARMQLDELGDDELSALAQEAAAAAAAKEKRSDDDKAKEDDKPDEQ